MAQRRRVAIRLILVLAVFGCSVGFSAEADGYPQRVVGQFAWADVPAQVRSRLEPARQRPTLPGALTRRAAGIPVPPQQITVVAAAAAGSFWLGRTAGAYRCPSDERLRCDYFAGRRYLPDDEVLAIYPESADGVWIRTKTGVSRIVFRPMTLEEKAQHFELLTRDRHLRHNLVGTSQLTRPGDLSSNRPYPNDNDGLWTAIYIGAESFRFAASKAPEARSHARDSLAALMRLESITGIPGFPARAYITSGEYRPPDGEWHGTPDGRFEWKGDTSSDELVGHFFAYSVYYDLAAGDAEKAAIRGVVGRMADHILSHGRYLVGPSGKPTTWGRWSPEYFGDKSGLGWCDSPLNALELLSFLKTAQHITGDARYAAEYRKLIAEGYARIAAERLKRRCELNYSDEELAMLAFYPLLQYERERELRAVYLDALEQWWENMPRQENPLWTFIYDQATGERIGLGGAERTLARYPLDLVHWNVRNSQRADVQPNPAQDRHGRAQITVLLPAGERPVMRWNANPFVVDGGDGGRSEDDGGAYLLAYWLGRYLGCVR